MINDELRWNTVDDNRWTSTNTPLKIEIERIFEYDEQGYLWCIIYRYGRDRSVRKKIQELDTNTDSIEGLLEIMDHLQKHYGRLSCAIEKPKNCSTCRLGRKYYAIWCGDDIEWNYLCRRK